MALPTIFRSTHTPVALRVRGAGSARGTRTPFFALSREMDRLFAEASRGFPAAAPATGFDPRVELREGEEEYRVSAELPGLASGDFAVEFLDGMLTLRGEKKAETSDASDAFRTERSYGAFERRIRIPGEVKSDTVKAAYRDGVLEVTLPKADSAKVREIEVEVG